MLRTERDGATWLVTQSDHAEVAGYLAAHWGNDAFTRPGHYGSPSLAERARAETIFAVAQHDNGWWEWDAAPDLDAHGLPLGLAEVLRDQEAGMSRWRVGLTRFADRPFANLLISHHASWLYALRTRPHTDPEYLHPLFWNRASEELYKGTREDDAAFVAELDAMRERWIDELRADGATATWCDPSSLLPNGRLLQLLDGLSLAVCADVIPPRDGRAVGLGGDAFELLHVPRRGWDDRVTIDVQPLDDRTLQLDPYPFAVETVPLPVRVPVRILDRRSVGGGHFSTHWSAAPLEVIEFRLVPR